MLGREIHDPFYAKHPLRFAPWDKARRVALYPNPLDSTAWLVPPTINDTTGAAVGGDVTSSVTLKHFVAYVKGAAGIRLKHDDADKYDSATPVVCGGQPSDASTLVVGDSLIGLHLDSDTFSVINVTVCRGSSQQGFVSAGPAVSLWQLNSTGCVSDWASNPSRQAMIPGGQRVDSSSPVGRRVSRVLSVGGAQVTVLRWEGVQLPDGASAHKGATVTVEVNVTVSALLPGRLTMSASVDRSHKGTCLQALALPNLPRLHLRSLAEDEMLLPEFFGVLGDVPQTCGSFDCDLDQTTTNYDIVGEGDWMPNGGKRNMQWSAIFSKSSGAPPLGLYLGSHDPLARIQALNAQGRYPNGSDPGVHAGWRWLHLPDNLLDSETTDIWTLPYSVVLEAIDGDWWDAAQVHRRWAIDHAVWTQAGTVAERAKSSAFPAWLLRTGLWVEGASNAQAVSHFTGVLMKALGISDLGVFWPFWNVQEFDSCYVSN